MTDQIRVEHGNRTDPLRPAEFDPADVRVVDFIDTDPPRLDPMFAAGLDSETFRLFVAAQAEEIARWKAVNVKWFGNEWPRRQCDHCGAHIRWAFVVEYLPTGQHFVAGQICGEERMQLDNRNDFNVLMTKKAAESRKETIGKLTAKAAWVQANPAEAAWIGAYEGGNDFLNNLGFKLNRYGSLSEKQTACITREIEKEAKREEQRAVESIALQDAAELVAGRYAITGEVVHVRVRENEWGTEHKMMVRAEDGNKFWVSVPQALYARAYEAGGEVKGAHVTVVAAWTPSNDDSHFAFGKRPTLKDAAFVAAEKEEQA